ncbi:MAG: hypothetical protein AB4041_03615 [Microcystaceae cyanobacterium]
MFILTARQVKPCRLHGTKKGESVAFNGIIYRKWLFIEGESFKHTETQKAFKRVQVVLENEKRLPILLDDGLGITLYYYKRAINPEKDIKNSPYRRDITGDCLKQALDLSFLSRWIEPSSLATLS